MILVTPFSTVLFTFGYFYDPSCNFIWYNNIKIASLNIAFLSPTSNFTTSTRLTSVMKTEKYSSVFLCVYILRSRLSPNVLSRTAFHIFFYWISCHKFVYGRSFVFNSTHTGVFNCWSLLASTFCRISNHLNSLFQKHSEHFWFSFILFLVTEYILSCVPQSMKSTLTFYREISLRFWFHKIVLYTLS